ncbi:hypothetical protein CSUI_003473 [Cystoisospora suis]|uniref:Uncharacterized protein n=1 Tax=Cystoisospora suis TaxID=483139 RepID=A0A2C6L4U7_9APIC|nr:hypothetical protein CSUI_003473 [Cystoisospora suis]
MLCVCHEMPLPGLRYRRMSGTERSGANAGRMGGSLRYSGRGPRTAHWLRRFSLTLICGLWFRTRAQDKLL